MHRRSSSLSSKNETHRITEETTHLLVELGNSVLGTILE